MTYRYQRHQSGQALVVGMFLLLVGSLAVLFFFSSGQVTAEKTRVTNTADAAAYSGALWRARILNYDAYSNRAIIAHEVAIAQAVTLVSWTQYVKTLSSNLATVASIYPPAGAVARAIARTANLVARETQRVAPIDIRARDSFVRILVASQDLLHVSAIPATWSVAEEVTNANDPNFGLRAILVGDGFLGLTEKYSGESRWRQARVIEDSLDVFVRDRRFQKTILPAPCLPPLTRWELRKAGGTGISSLQRWEAADAHSLWASSGYWRRFRCRWSHLEIPLGWGAADSPGLRRDASPRSPWRATYGWDNSENANFGSARSINPWATDLAVARTQHLAGYTGIPLMRDLARVRPGRVGPTDPSDPRPRYAVMVSRDGSGLRTASTIGVGGRLSPEEHLAAGGLHQLSAAELYFMRPRNFINNRSTRADGKQEYASLYNPFWQARLTAPTPAERAQALLLAH